MIGSERKLFVGNDMMSVPSPLIRLLLQIAVTHSDFNEDGYLTANPDIKDAIRRNSVDSAFAHYVGFGYFEGRLGATPEVDEAWYLKAYPDVSQALALGNVTSAQEHFNVIGAGEGRSPNPAYVAEAFQWKKALAPEGIA